jgi:negative regulator of sigma-B (phosphoserine phosphatase)
VVAEAVTADWPAALETGVAGATHAGERRSGDLAVFVPTAAGGLAVLIDGLGHGDAAADAAEGAARVIRAEAESAPGALLERCHAALRRTRGVVMTLAWFELAPGRLRWGGVGNVEGRLLRADGRQESALVLGGVVGYNLPRLRLQDTELDVGDAVVLATDGIGAAYSSALRRGASAQRLADAVFAAHHKGTDDALVAVVRRIA